MWGFMEPPGRVLVSGDLWEYSLGLLVRTVERVPPPWTQWPEFVFHFLYEEAETPLRSRAGRRSSVPWTPPLYCGCSQAPRRGEPPTQNWAPLSPSPTSQGRASSTRVGV